MVAFEIETLHTAELIISQIRPLSNKIANLNNLVDAVDAVEQVKRLRIAAQVVKATLAAKNQAALIHIAAQARAGAILYDTPRNKAGRRAVDAKPNPIPNFVDVVREAGISRPTAARWQRLYLYYSQQEIDYHRIINFMEAYEIEITTSAILRRAAALPLITSYAVPLDTVCPIQHGEIVPHIIRLGETGAATYGELLRTGWLQTGEESEAVHVWDLTEAILLRVLRERGIEHALEGQAQQREYICNGEVCTPAMLKQLQDAMSKHPGKKLIVQAWYE